MYKHAILHICLHSSTCYVLYSISRPPDTRHAARSPAQSACILSSVRSKENSCSTQGRHSGTAVSTFNHMFNHISCQDSRQAWQGTLGNTYVLLMSCASVQALQQHASSA
jgi:hypothetical protein